MLLVFFSFLFFPLSSHSFVLASSSFQSIVLEFVVLNSARTICHYIFYICEVTLNHHTVVIRIIWCTSIMPACSVFVVNVVTPVSVDFTFQWREALCISASKYLRCEISTKLHCSGQRQGIRYVILLAAYFTCLPKFWKSYLSALIAHICSLSLCSGVSTGLSKVVCVQVGHNSLEQH